MATSKILDHSLCRLRAPARSPREKEKRAHQTNAPAPKLSAMRRNVGETQKGDRPMTTNLGEGDISSKVLIFGGVGAAAGAILGAAALGFPAAIASTIVFALGGAILGSFF
jgi:hypothetical protein